MESITVSSLDNLQQLVVTAGHSFVADEPEGVGDGLGPDPYELLLAALGTCTAMTILLYTRKKRWTLRSVTVHCSHERVRGKDSHDGENQEDARIDVIRQRVLLHGDLTDEQRVRVGQIAGRCPVRRTLESAPRIEDTVEVLE